MSCFVCFAKSLYFQLLAVLPTYWVFRDKLDSERVWGLSYEVYYSVVYSHIETCSFRILLENRCLTSMYVNINKIICSTPTLEHKAKTYHCLGVGLAPNINNPFNKSSSATKSNIYGSILHNVCLRH